MNMMDNNFININGNIIYQPSGKAREYAHFAANFHNGCSNGCVYCYNRKGMLRAILGQDFPTLKKSLGNENRAIKMFTEDILRFRDILIADGPLHFTFVSDPCLPETVDLVWKCVNIALFYGVPVQILTKRADWIDNPIVQKALNCSNKHLLKVGFTLTGKDDQEPRASTNEERIAAMKRIHDMGISTWASIEPVIDPKLSMKMILESWNFCDHYKVGLISGIDIDYNPDKIKNLKALIESPDLRSKAIKYHLDPNHTPTFYWKKSILDYINAHK